jgi:alpha-mannosidase
MRQFAILAFQMQTSNNMKASQSLFIIAGLWSALASAQTDDTTARYNIDRDTVLYTVGYAHLDTEWNWDYPTTIDEYIPNTMKENFRLFEKYPDYVFNFTGSRRYQMMKEYYPELYAKVVDYVKQGRWCVSGSSVDEGEVNISSSESVIRQVLYGNIFFQKEFGKTSADYMLPDCFGFIANLPTIWNHCGLLGFSTQKLTWRSAVGVPFHVGIWNGPDGNGVVAALDATDYTGRVEPRLDLDKTWIARINENKKNYGVSFDYRYYGVGDQGGSPRESSVRNAIGSLRNSDSKIKVLLTSSDQMFKDITPEIRKKLPVYSGDLLLIEHSAGSLSSQAYMKRANRKNELLAQAAEQLAVFADWTGAATYPLDKLDRSWNLMLGSQFHDILPGTSIPKAYEYAWNDEFIAGNGFAEVLKNSVRAVSRNMNTQTQGKAVIVYNPVAKDREDIVTAELEYTKVPENIVVADMNGHLLPSQIISREENKLKFLFLARVPSLGLAVFDVRETTEKTDHGVLSVTDQLMENEYYRIKIAPDGDIQSIFDKKISRELLAHPARLEFLHEKPDAWPSWNMDWKDRKNPPVDFMDKEASIRILENGPVRVALQIRRKGQNSGIDQIISLAAGEAGKRIEVANTVDWQSKEVSLKASFPLTAGNERATYSLGVGTIQRNSNNEKKFEVPAKEWFDLTDSTGKYGVSILEDCKYGSDKPDKNTLRLTLLYTPGISESFKWCTYQNSQDWGIHDVKYGIYGHGEDWSKGESPWQARFFNQPMLAFEAPDHDGILGKEISLLSVNSSAIGIMALKKMEEGEYYILRVNELYGKDAKGIQIKLWGKIEDAYEVNGQEKKIGKADFSDRILSFDISHYTIRSFAIKCKPFSKAEQLPEQISIDLPYNQDAMSFDDNRWDGSLLEEYSMPAELIPAEVVSEDIHFKMGNTADGQKNAISCNRQKINLPPGNYSKVYVLAASTEDTKGDFLIDDQQITLGIQKWNGYVGQFYNRTLNPEDQSVVKIDGPYTKRDNIAWFASHRHIAYPSKNDAYQYCYMFKYAIDVHPGAKTLTLPADNRIILFAVTAIKENNDNVKVLQPLYDDFRNNQSFQLRNPIIP